MWLGEMLRRKRFSRNVLGVSEVLGAMLLIVIAVVAFAAIYNYVFPLRLPSPEPNVKIMGYVVNSSGDYKIYLEHMGGEQLVTYNVLVEQSSGIQVYHYENQPWRIGESYTPPINQHEFAQEQLVRVTVVAIQQDGSQRIVFDGPLTPESKPFVENGGDQTVPTDPALQTTLRTDTGDEDLICYSYTVNTTITPTSYIYSWSTKTGGITTPFARLLMPFNTNNAITSKDYSGNGYNGTITGATWIPVGKVGGAYSFDGTDAISLPYCFDGAYLGQLTVEGWLKTSQTSGTLLSYDPNNYFELALSNSRLKWSTNSSDQVADTNGNSIVSNDQWHYVAAMYDAVSGDSKIYIDGLLDTSAHSHTAGSLLGSGDMPLGALGKGTGTIARQTIFSNGFETQAEKNNWQEHNGSGGQSQTWTTLVYDNFNSGWGSYTDGDGSGSDCYRTSSYKYEGTYSACVRDNSGTYSSFYTTNGIDVHTPQYKTIKIDFWWMWNGIGWSNGEDWWVRYYDGSVWNTILDMNYPSGRTTNVWYHTVIYVNESNYNFPTGMKIRFQCDAYDDNDRVYFDKIYINATSWGRIESDFDLRPASSLIPYSGSYSLGGSGDFDPEYARFNRTSIDVANYSSVQLSVWYSYKNTEDTDFFGLYYKNTTQWAPIFELNDPTMPSGQSPWTKATVIIPSSIKKIVLQFMWQSSSTDEFVAIDDLEITGIPRGGEGNYTGLLDEIKIYDHVLSAEQIYQNYLLFKDGRSNVSVIVAEETNGELNWQCLVTPNNGIVDDLATFSNIVHVKTSYSGSGGG